MQQNPALLPQIIQQIASTNPELMNAIRDNQEEFVRLLNAPVAEGGAAAAGAGQAVNPQAGDPGAGPVQIMITEDERNAINRVCFRRIYVICFFLA